MLRLKTLASGSSGNCYLLDSGKEVLVLDCGIPIKQIKKGLDFDVSRIAGVCVTHGHLDHAKSVKAFEDMGITVFKPYDKYYQVKPFGNFTVKPFDLTNTDGKWMHTNNDGSEFPCYGFLIQHPDMGRMLYITDTELVKWKFKEINHILISCNYDKDLIPQDHPARNHIFRGHMELQTVKRFIKSNNSNVLRNVILCHLSGENSDKDKMVAEVEKVANCPVCVAKKGLEIELRESNFPF